MYHNSARYPLDMSDENVKKPELPSDESLMDRLKDVRERLDADLTEVEVPEVKVERIDPLDDPEFRQKFDALQAKARRTTDDRQVQKTSSERKREQDQESARGLGLGMSIAYTILGLPIFGWIVGYFLDGPTRNGAKNMGVLIGAFVGVTAAIIMLQRANPPKK